MVKGSIQDEDITAVNIYVLKIEASQYIKQITEKHKRRNWQYFNSRRMLLRLQLNPSGLIYHLRAIITDFLSG